MKLSNTSLASGASLVLLALALGAGCVSSNPGKFSQGESEPLVLVVLDPLAKELACACVEGFGQRDYRKLAARLETALNQPVNIEFSDDLAESIAWIGLGREMIIVGQRSSVAEAAGQAGLPALPICELTDPDGSTTLTGSFVARADDSAQELKDIGGRTLLFGLANSQENHAAAEAALTVAGGAPPVTSTLRDPYIDAALDLLDSSSSPLPIAIIPSYGLRLMVGCGTIRPGELKVIGSTLPLPFVTVFVADSIAAEKQRIILEVLLAIRDDADLLKAMESRDGFKAVKSPKPFASQSRAEPDWPDWRGPNRDGRVPQLPTRLPETARFVWKKAAMTGGLAGLSVSGDRLILAERDFSEEHDVYRCLDVRNGELLWRIEFPVRGRLDYGQSPRATPVIRDGRAYLLGAFGDLRCVDVAEGTVIWERHLPREFDAEVPTWGMCATPLVVDHLLVVNPGGPNASLAALDRVTGQTRWTTPGPPAAYASFICAELGGRRQIIGYDQHSLGGWDVTTGERLWQLVPPMQGDFNVPTPIAVNGGLVVATENNGTRFYEFGNLGRIVPEPSGAFADLAPDTTTPVVTCGRIFGAHLGLSCLDLGSGLKPVWYHDEEELGDYATLIADDRHVLVITLGGELLLLDGRADEYAVISRLRVFDDDVEVYAHPALVGTRLYLWGGSSLVCVDLGTD